VTRKPKAKARKGKTPPVAAFTGPATSHVAGALLLEAKAVQLRARRYSYREIAAELGVSVGGAYKAVRRGLAKVTILVGQEADNLVALELESLDMAARALEGRVRLGDKDAVDQWLKVHDRRKSLLRIAPSAMVAVAGLTGGPVMVELSWGEGEAPGAGPERAPAVGFVVEPTREPTPEEEPDEDVDEGRSGKRTKARPARGTSPGSPRRPS
jgi:hypothetical protein